jgi:hypothetical protein
MPQRVGAENVSGTLAVIVLLPKAASLAPQAPLKNGS